MISIPTRTHGISDYMTGAAMLAAPLLMKNRSSHISDDYMEEYGDYPKESNGSTEGTVLGAMGATILTQSLMTDYEAGAVKMMSMPAHLMMDVAAGVMLAASPWLLNMNPKARLPIAMLGLGIAAMGLLTNVRPANADEESDDE